MLRTRTNLLTRRARKRWQRLSPSTRALPHYVGQAIANFNRHGLRQAAALAYYAIFSIFPLSLLLAVLLSGFLGPTLTQEQISSGLSLFLPTQTLDLFQTNVADALRQGQSFGLIALAGLVWSGLGLFSNITTSLDLIFQVPASRSMWKQRMTALGMAVMLIVLVTLSFMMSGVLRLISAASLARPSNWLMIGIWSLPFCIDMVIFALLFRYVPSKYVRWDAVWPAAIFGAAGWELLKAGFNWYMDNLANFQFIYGSIATAIILLFWGYLIASIFLLSAEFCAQLNEWMNTQHKQQEAQIFLESKPLGELPPEPELVSETPDQRQVHELEQSG